MDNINQLKALYNNNCFYNGKHEHIVNTTIRIARLQVGQVRFSLREAVLLGYMDKRSNLLENRITKTVNVDVVTLSLLLGWNEEDTAETMCELVNRGCVIYHENRSFSINKPRVISSFIRTGSTVPIMFLREKEYGGIGLENGYTLSVLLKTYFEDGKADLGKYEGYPRGKPQNMIQIIQKCIPNLCEYGFVNCQMHKSLEKRHIIINRRPIKSFINRMWQFLRPLGFHEKLTPEIVRNHAAEFRTRIGFEIKSQGK